MKVADKNELIRVLTEDGKLTNKFEQRKLVHKLGIYHQEVAFIPLSNDGCVLLQKRSKNKKQYPNCWALCAGHVVGKQTTLQAAVMEANEELGLNLCEKDLMLLVSKTRNDREDNKCFATCYYKFLDKDTQFNKQDEEVEELKWFSFSDFVKMVSSEENCIFKNNEYYQKIIKNLNNLLFKDKNL